MALAPVARQESADSQLLALKVPPHSVEAEQSLLGALLNEHQAFDNVADLVAAVRGLGLRRSGLMGGCLIAFCHP